MYVLMKLFDGLLDLVGAVVDHDRLQQHRPVIGEQLRAAPEVGREVLPADGLDHLDRHELVVGASKVTVVLEQDRHAILQTERAHALARVGVLFAGNRRGGHTAAVVLGRIDGEPAPAGPDLQHMVGGRKVELCADPLQLGERGLFQGGPRRVEDRAGVHHRGVEEAPEQLVPQVVMRGDLPARAADRVAPQPAHPALHWDQHRREHAAQGVERTNVQSGDAGQRDEVRALPQAVHVGLAQADAAAQERPVEARRAHLQGDPQRAQGRCVAEGVALGALDEGQLTIVNATQQAQHEATGQPVAPARLRLGLARGSLERPRSPQRSNRAAHVGSAPFCGWGKYLAPRNFSRRAWV